MPLSHGLSATRITIDNQTCINITYEIDEILTASELMGRRTRAIKNIEDRLTILQSQFEGFATSIAADLVSVDLKLEEIASLTVNEEGLEKRKSETEKAGTSLASEANDLGMQKQKLSDERTQLTAQLNEPQQRYQKYVEEHTNWKAAIDVLVGNEKQPESKIGLETRLAQIEKLPETLATRQFERIEISKQIYLVLAQQRDARAELFAPIQKLIQDNALIREEYKLQFQANLQGSPETIADNLFGMVKQSVGELRGEDESFIAIRRRFEKYSYKSAEDAASFASELYQLISESKTEIQKTLVGIRSALRKDREPVDVYDYVFGLQYLEPKYTLLFQDTEIEQLSPGQRGALLLVFYLLVDKGRNPIVLDQPEENLDNETVVSLLVPVLNEAKKTRQILMVTHNPNLAVVCDAEQIIHASFDRKGGSKISYKSGSIEEGDLNRAVVDILEGTKVAFDSRGRTYHPHPK